MTEEFEGPDRQRAFDELMNETRSPIDDVDQVRELEPAELAELERLKVLPRHGRPGPVRRSSPAPS